MSYFSPNILNYNAIFAKNAKCTTFTGTANPTGVNTDIYTCPTGRKAFIGVFQCTRTTGATATLFLYAKIGGSYYPINAQSIASGTAVVSITNPPFIIEAGQSFAYNASQSFTTYQYQIFEFDADIPVKTHRVAPAVTDTVIYTVPTGKSAIMTTNNGLISASGQHVNLSGLSSNVTFKIKIGGTTSNTSTTASVAANTSSGISVNFPLLAAGDTVEVAVSQAAATQNSFCTVIEL